MSVPKMSASAVFDRLAAGPFAEPAHVMLAGFAKLIDGEHEAAELRSAALAREQDLAEAKRLREAVYAFERDTGLTVHPGRWGNFDTKQIGELVRAARMLGDLSRLPEQLRAAARQIEEAHAAIAPSAGQKSA